MVDAGGSDAFWPHGYKWALRTARCWPAYDVAWFEEALPPDDLDGFIELRRHSPVPIATGEVLTRRQSFWPFLEQHAVDIIQPDCTKCGGLTEAWRIAWMAYDHNIRWCRTAGTRRSAWRRTCTWRRRCRWRVRRVPDAVAVHRRVGDEAVRPDADGFLRIPTDAGPGRRAEPGGAAAVRGGREPADLTQTSSQSVFACHGGAENGQARHLPYGTSRDSGR